MFLANNEFNFIDVADLKKMLIYFSSYIKILQKPKEYFFIQCCMNWNQSYLYCRNIHILRHFFQSSTSYY